MITTELSPSEKIQALFQTSRMRGAWSMLTAANPNERANALDTVNQLLSGKGLSLLDVLAVISPETSAATAPKPAPTPQTSAPSPFENIFSGMMRDFMGGASNPAAQPPARRPGGRPTQILQGTAIPRTIHGKIIISEERQVRHGPMIVFTVEGDNHIYGPIVSFGESNVAPLREAARNERDHILTIKIPPRSDLMPIGHICR